MFREYISFLGWPMTIYVTPVAIGVAAGALMWINNRKSAAAFGLAAAVSTGAYLLHLLSSFCMHVSIPAGWPTVCVAVGWIFGIAIFFAAVAGSKGEDGAGCGSLVFGVIMGYIVRYALQFGIGPYVIFPFIKYVVGYFIYMAPPAALLVLWVIVAVNLLRPSVGLRWLLIPFLYFACLTVFLLAKPALMEQPKTYFADALTAAAPCAMAIVALGIKRSFKILLFCMTSLYSWGFALLLQAIRMEPAENQIGLYLLSTPLAWALCLVLVSLVVHQVLHSIKYGLSKVEKTPLWVVAMPWVSLVPAFYFAKLGIEWFLIFVLANLLVGLALIVWVKCRFALVMHYAWLRRLGARRTIR